MKDIERIAIGISILVLGYIFYSLNLEIFNQEEYIITLGEIEVNNITACCLDMSSINYFENNSYYNEVGGMTNLKSLDNMGDICITEENLIYYDLACREIKKEDIDREWLNLNAECLECYNKEENWISYEMPICEYKCNEYKFGDYIIK